MAVRFLLAIVSITVLFAVCAGCRSFDLRRRIPWKTSKQLRTEMPMKIMVTWTDAIRHRPNRRPVRGFGGRVYFYGKEQHKPIAVDGAIVVYAFDESERSVGNAVPDRKYVFPPNQVAQLHSETSLGDSYNLWIPWDEVGGDQKRISLIVRFEPDSGQTVVGNQTTSLLPGRLVQSAKPAGDGDPVRESRGLAEPVQRAGFERPVPPGGGQPTTVAPRRRRMNTTTISVGERRGRPLPGVVRRQRLGRNAAGRNGARRRRRAQAQLADTPPLQTTHRSDRSVEATAANGPTDRPRRARGFVPVIPRVPIAPVARPALGRPRLPPFLEGSTFAPAIQDQFPPRSPVAASGRSTGSADARRW